ELHFMKKIPSGAEASNVLVGELDFLLQPLVAFIRLSPAVLLSGMTEVPIPTRFLFVLLGPEGKAHQYHEIGRSMATIMTDEIFHDVAYKAKDRADLVAGIDEFLDQVTVLPPGEWDPSIRIEPPKNVPSQVGAPAEGGVRGRGGRAAGQGDAAGGLFGGFVRDVKRKAPWFWSDFRDGGSLQCLATFLFLYCACMSPVITFGGLLGEATHGHISAMESLLGASMTGVVYSLFAGQPLTILGSTGPVLVFEKILYKFCKGWHRLPREAVEHRITECEVMEAPSSPYGTLHRELMEASFSPYGTLHRELMEVSFSPYGTLHRELMEAAFSPYGTLHRELMEASFSPYGTLHRELMEAAFSPFPLLPPFLFLQECRYLHGEFQGPACGRDGPYTPNVLFWCCILFFSTFILSSLLKKFKTSPYFPTRVRSTVSDFAVFLTIVIMVLMDILIGIPSPKLHVPHVFKPTRDDRGWVINPIGPNPWWTVLAALIPALLCTILIFMDQQITAVIVNRNEHRLK
ncbi:S4A10 protein, partial [Psilopogon haemacephalus]|nr:S4A10 protein [Psilopogon haemacephalus]